MHVVIFWYSYQKTNACGNFLILISKNQCTSYFLIFVSKNQCMPCAARTRASMHACMPVPMPMLIHAPARTRNLSTLPPQSSKNTYLQRTLNSLPLQSSKIHIFQQNLNILPLQNSKICMLPMKSQHSALPKLQNTYISIETSKSCPPKASKWTHFQRNLSILPFQSWNISLTTSQQSARPELQNA